MKKVLLLIAAGLLASLGLVAQTTVSMPWNSYSSAPKVAYQAKDDSKVSTYVPKVGDVVTVTLEFTSDQDVSALQVALVDDAAPSYWTELAGFKALGDITKGTKYNFSVDLAVTATGAPKVVFDGKNATLAGADGTGTSINLTLTVYTVSIFSPIAGATVLTDNGAGAKQVTSTKLDAATKIKTDDVVRVTISGVSDVDATDFQVILIDESADATKAYWTELSAFTALTPAAVTAGQTFTLTADVTVLATPAGTSTKNQNIALIAKSTGKIIQLSLTSYTAVIVPVGGTVAVTGVTLDKTTATLTKVGATAQLTATIAPADATVKTYTYITSDAKVATVSATGLVTAVANGTATITVSTTDGAKTATSVITVSIPKTGISILDLGISQKGKVFTFDGSAKLLNLLGQVVLTGENTIDASFVAPGIYFITKDNTTLEISVQ